MSTAVLPSAATARPLLFPWIGPVAGLALSSAMSLICLAVAGPSHGVLFGACLVAALLTPSLVSGESGWRGALLVTLSLMIGCTGGPLVALLQGDLNGRLFSTLVAVVTPFVLALAGLSSLLAFVRVPAAIVATMVTLLALAWLGWPVWLSPWLSGNESLVSVLSPTHPLLTIDAAVTREGGTPWMEHRLMYAKLTVLGQHVFPRPPQGVGASALFHGVTGLTCFIPVAGLQLWKSRGSRQPRADWDEFEAV